MNHWLKITSEGVACNGQPCIVVSGGEIKVIRPNSIVTVGNTIYYANGGISMDGWHIYVPYGAECGIKIIT